MRAAHLPVLALLSVVLAVVMCGSASLAETAATGEPAVVTAEGLAPIQGRDIPAARNAAMEDACRNAVEQACGVHLTSESRVRDFQLVGDAILARASGYVKTYQVLSEREQEGTYRVAISAQVALTEIERYLACSLMVSDFTGTGQQMGKTLADVFTTAFAGSPRYVVLERTPVRLAVADAIVPGIDVFGEEAATKAAKQLGARLLVVGSCASQAAEVTLLARVIDLATGRVVANGTATVFGDARNLLYLSGQLANRLHYHLTGMWLPGPGAGADTPQERLLALQAIDPTRLLASSSTKIKVSLTTNRGANPTYRPGDAIILKAQVDHDCYLTIYNIDSQGRVTLLFPNRFQMDNAVKAGKTYLVPTPDARWELRVQGEPGTEYIQAVATVQPLALCQREEFAKSAFPTLSETAEEFMSKGVAAALKQRPPDEWTTALVKFYLAPQGQPQEVGR